MQLRIVLVILIISAESFGAPAPAPIPQQSSTPLILSISDAIKKGLDYSPDVKKAEGSVKETSGNLDKARGALFPTIAATAQAITAGLSLYKTNEDIAKQALFTAKQTLLTNLLTAYYTLVQGEMTLEAAQANRDILKSYVEITTHYAHIGRSRKMDELQAQANYSLALIDVEQVKNTLGSSQSNINRYLGEPKSAPVKSNYRVTISPIGNLNVQDALETAVKSNPQIIADKLNVSNVANSRDVDLAADMPNLYFNATGGYQSPDVPDMWQSSSQYYSAGFTLTVPIFSGLTSFSKRKIYAAQTYEQQKQLQSDTDALRVQIESAILSIHSTQAQLDVAVRSVKEARAALDLANKGYRDGTASSTDVITLQATRYTAEKGFITAQFAYLTALLTLRQQMGIDLEKAYEH
jgi:outer membrane protein